MSSDNKWLRAVAVVTVLALASVGVASAQQFGNLYGTVADESGTSLPGVTVSLEGMGAPRTTVTDEKGQYRFLGLDPGSYYIKAELDGFSTVEQPNVVVALNRNTTINFTLSSAVEDVITVTSESPLLDERKLQQGANISQVELEKIPTGRDPWSIVNQAPGVMTDRINVGGNESGQQSVFRGPGVSDDENDFQVDGIQITDMAAIGASPTYYDFEQFEAVELSTGGSDVSKNSAGVGVNMVTRRGTNEFRGTARFLSAKGNGLGFLGQSGSDFNCADAGETQDCDSIAKSGKGINSINEYGFEAGGPAVTDRLWFWGSYGVSDIRQFNTGGGADDTVLENTSVKINGQITSSNSATASWNNGDKKKFGRGASPTRPQATTWDQRGPTALWKFEDTHVFSSNLYMTGAYSKIDGGFALTTKATLASAGAAAAPEALWNSDGIWQDNYQSGFSRRPTSEVKLDGSYFFNTGEVAHELKFGGRMREASTSSLFIWPGRNILHFAGEAYAGNDGTPDYFQLLRYPDGQEFTNDYTSLWVQDTISRGNWTLNAGLRFDLQEGTIGGASTSGVPPEFQDLLPPVTAGSRDAGFDWSTVVPRIGATYALGEDRDTLLRGSFSMFPEQLQTGDIDNLNGTSYSYAYLSFIDGNGNDKWDDASEPYELVSTAGFNPDDPLEVANKVSSGLKPNMTMEIILGVEHSLLPEFVIGANFTMRNVSDIQQTRQLITGPGITDPLGRPWTMADFVREGSACGDLPNGEEACSDAWTLGPAFSRTGGTWLATGTRERNYQGISFSFNKRLSNNWGLRGFFNFGEAEWDVPSSYTSITDPNNMESGADQDGAVYTVESSGSGRGNIYLQSSWQANVTGIYQIAPDRPWGFTMSGNVYTREGYPVLYQRTKSGSNDYSRVHNLQGSNTDRFRTDDPLTVDLRAEKEFTATGNVSLTFGLDLFNALNEATVLARQPNTGFSTFNWVQDNISPRIWKLGVRVSWR